MTANAYNEPSGLERNLNAQLDRLWRHCNQSSIKTRHRYREAERRFIRFLAERYHLQKLANVRDKHVVAYISYLIQKAGAKGRPPNWATIKTDLSAIRFWHDQLGARPISDNNKLAQLAGIGTKLARVPFVSTTPRAWTDQELAFMQQAAIHAGEERFAAAMALAHNLGLRRHEVTRLDRAAAEAALRSGALTVKGKGGLVRTVPLEGNARQILGELVSRTPRGSKLFVRQGEKTHQVLENLEKFIRTHQPPGRDRGKLTFHGLRHSYAQRKYKEFRAQGLDDREARLRVSRLLGHGRVSVTKKYFVGMPIGDTQP